MGARTHTSSADALSGIPGEVKHLDSPYLHLLEDVVLDPIFVIGQHRTGTTILLKCLLAAGRFNTSTIYHVVYRRCLLHLHSHPREAAARRAALVRYFESHQITTRQYDAIAVGPDQPEEYGEALDHLGRRPMLTEGNLPSFLRFARKVQFVSASGRTLLLKNPWDTVRFLFIAETFPSARFIFIHRNPVDVIDSQIRMYASVLREKNHYEVLFVERYRELYERPVMLRLARWLYLGRSPLLYWMAARNVGKANDFILANRHQLVDRAIDITYADLCTRPQETIQRVMGFLGMEPARQPDYAGLIHPRSRPLLPIVARWRDSIVRRNKRYCRATGV